MKKKLAVVEIEAVPNKNTSPWKVSFSPAQREALGLGGKA